MSEPMTEARLAEIKARANAATPGPWEWRDTTDDSPDPRGPGSHVDILSCGEFRVARRGSDAVSDVDAQRIANLAFIVNARLEVPALVAEVKRLRIDLDAALDREKSWGKLAERGDELERAYASIATALEVGNDEHARPSPTEAAERVRALVGDVEWLSKRMAGADRANEELRAEVKRLRAKLPEGA